jgi:hypothetical protein
MAGDMRTLMPGAGDFVALLAARFPHVVQSAWPRLFSQLRVGSQAVVCLSCAEAVLELPRLLYGLAPALASGQLRLTGAILFLGRVNTYFTGLVVVTRGDMVCFGVLGSVTLIAPPRRVWPGPVGARPCLTHINPKQQMEPIARAVPCPCYSNTVVALDMGTDLGRRLEGLMRFLPGGATLTDISHMRLVACVRASAAAFTSHASVVRELMHTLLLQPEPSLASSLDVLNGGTSC